MGHTHTPPWWGPKEDTGLRENDTTTRPRAPEGRPGALQGHHRGSNEACSHTQAGARGMAAAQLSPPQGGPLAGHTPGRRSKRICCVQSPTAPTRHPKAGDGRPKVRAGGHTPTPAFLTLPEGQGGKDRRGAPRTDREERTRSLGTPVPRPARLRPGPGEHNHTTSIS